MKYFFNSDIKKILEDRIFLILSAGVSLICSFIILKLALDMLGLEGRGLLIIVITYSTLACNLIRFGLNQGSLNIFKKLNNNLHKKEQAVNCYIALSIWQSIIGSTVFIILTSLFFQNTISYVQVDISYLGIYLGIFIFNSAIVFFASMQSEGRISFEYNLIYNFILISFLFLYDNFSLSSVESFVIAMSFSMFIGTVFLFFRTELPFKLFIVQKDAMALLKSGGKLVVWQNFKDLMYKIDLILLPSILSAQNFGLYTVIQTISQSIWRLTDPLLGIYQRELTQETRRSVVNSSLKVFIFLLSCICYGFLCLWVVKIFINPNMTDMDVYIIAIGAITLMFNYWKLKAVELVVLGKNIFMYISISMFLISYLCLYKFIDSLNEAILLAIFCYSLITVTAFFLSKNISKI